MREDMTQDERIEKGQVHARYVIEMLGAPAEHIDKTLREYIDKLKKDDQDILIIGTEFSEPKQQEKLWSIYVELEVWLKDLPKVVEFCFDALPSSIEILEPQQLTFKGAELSALLNDLQAKIHQYDYTLKDSNAKIKLLTKNSAGLMKNFVFLSLKKEEKTIDQIGTEMGIKGEEIKPFLDLMIKGKELEMQGNKYHSLVR
jgi:cellulose biosynthesis protein BcsQ